MNDLTTRPTGDRPLETVAEQVHVPPARIRYYVRIGLLTPRASRAGRVYFSELGAGPAAQDPPAP